MVRRAKKEDAVSLAKLAMQIWSSHDLYELKGEYEMLLDDEDAVCFIKCEVGNLILFAQCGLRNDYVEGTQSSPVGYLEFI